MPTMATMPAPAWAICWAPAFPVSVLVSFSLVVSSASVEVNVVVVVVVSTGVVEEVMVVVVTATEVPGGVMVENVMKGLVVVKPSVMKEMVGSTGRVNCLGIC